MKKKIVTVLMMAALGSSLVFSQAAMAADTTAKTETADADKDAADTETSDTETADDETKDEDLKTIGEKPEEDTEGVLSVKLKNLTGKVITGVAVKNEKDEKYPDNFLKDEDKFEADEERVLWFDPNAKDKADEENKDAADDTAETKTAADDTKTDEKSDSEDKDAAEKETPKYNIQLTFEDGTTAEIHTFPFGDTEEAELHLEGEVAYLVFDSISQKKEYNTLQTEKDLLPKPTEAPAQTTSESTESYDNSSDYDYSNDYDYNYDSSDYDYDYDGSDDGDYNNGDSDDGGSDDGGNGCLDDGLLN